ncbi:hypothetical protein LXA43DRAFT_1065275 [Ganoderma leucocontextum]|nr:hypothetical protein LXA43DRAFT_1065275 [Ganoderma leucocontextum]
MQPARRLQSEPPSDAPQLYPFLSVLWRQQQPGEELDLTLPAQVYIGSGHYTAREPEDSPELAYEIRLVGTGRGPDRQPEHVDTTLMFPSTADAVVQDYHRWQRWITMLQSANEIALPTLLPQQRRSLLNIARFLRALATPGARGVSLSEWPLFWAILMDRFPPSEHLRRGEVHLLRVSRWLRDRYPLTSFGTTEWEPTWLRQARLSERGLTYLSPQQ